MIPALCGLVLAILMAATPHNPSQPMPDGLSDAAIEQLARIYADAAARLGELVLHPKGASESSQAYSLARAASLLVQVDGIRAELRLAAASWLGPNLKKSFAAGVEQANEQLAQMGLALPAKLAQVGAALSTADTNAAIRMSFNLVDRHAVEVLARDTAGDLVKAADAMTGRASSLIRRTAQLGLSEARINQILAGGIISGQPAATIRQLRDELIAVHGKTVPIVDKNGDTINFKAADYARLVVRTRTREATEIARHERLQAKGIDLVKIVGRNSGNFCTAFLGMVFSISGKTPGWPALSELPGHAPYKSPPFHPNCSKSTAPFSAALANPAEMELARGVADAHSLMGMTPAEAQKAYKGLQLKEQQIERYPRLVRRAHGGGSKAA